MPKLKRDACTECHYNLLCEGKPPFWNMFYCVGCQAHAAIMGSTFLESITGLRHGIPDDCRFVSREKAIKKEKLYKEFVRHKLELCKKKLQQREGHSVTFANYELREFMCSDCADKAQLKLNTELANIKYAHRYATQTTGSTV